MSETPVIIHTYDEKPIPLNAASTTDSFSYYGMMDDDLPSVAAAWCTKLGVQGDAATAFNRFWKAAKPYFKADQTAVWMTVRLCTASPLWQIPRPHADGGYWNPERNSAYSPFKVGTCLLGPGTLFWQPREGHTSAVVDMERLHWLDGQGSRDKRKSEGWEQSNSADMLKLREWQKDEMKGLHGIERVQVQQGQLARWIVGTDGPNDGIHYEPDMTDMPEGRIFISLLPGTEAQIRKLTKNWEEPFMTSAAKLLT